MGRVDGSEIFKRHPPVLQLFFSSACRILLDLWTFSPVGARERSLRICMCARACARTPDYQYQKPVRGDKKALPKMSVSSQKYTQIKVKPPSGSLQATQQGSQSDLRTVDLQLYVSITGPGSGGKIDF